MESISERWYIWDKEASDKMFKLKLPRERKERMIEEVRRFCEEEYGGAVGSIAAERLLDYVVSVAGPAVYNEAVRDARAVLADRMAAMEDELYALEKRDPAG